MEVSLYMEHYYLFTISNIRKYCQYCNIRSYLPILSIQFIAILFNKNSTEKIIGTHGIEFDYGFIGL